MAEFGSGSESGSLEVVPSSPNCNRRNPFILFPEEVWDYILEEVEDTDDILTLLKTYPELDQCFQKKKRLWLFGKVLGVLLNQGHRFNHLEENILVYRLVCKRWCDGVREYLRNRPEYTPYDPETEGALATRNHFRDFQCQYDSEDDYKGPLKEKSVYGEVALCTTQKIREFIEEFEDLVKTTGRSPFPSGSVTITIEDWDEEYSEVKGDKNAYIWSKALDFSLNFGVYISALEIGFQYGSVWLSDVLFWRHFIEFLSRLPNLSYLRIKEGKWDSSSDSSPEAILTSIRSRGGFPFLPKLSTIEIANGRNVIGAGCYPVLRSLLQHYSKQLRRLDAEPSYLEDVVEFPKCFPNLTELIIPIVEHSSFDRKNNQELLRNVLTTLECDKLARLKIVSATFTLMEFGLESDIFQWLRRFPSLQSFSIALGFDSGRIGSIKEESVTLRPPPKTFLFPSLTYLKIPESFWLNFSFLVCFPNLQYLNIVVEEKPRVLDLSLEATLPIRIREQIQTGRIYESNVWDLLPNLKYVSLIGRRQANPHDWEHQYAREVNLREFRREEYEELEGKGMKWRESEYHDLRPDLWNFLLEQYRTGLIINFWEFIAGNGYDGESDDDDDDDDDDELDYI